MRAPRLAARTLALGVAFSVGSIACALVAGLEDKEPYPANRRDAAGPAENDAATDSQPATGTAPVGVIQVVASGQMKPWGVAVDDAYVYWTNEGDNTVVRAAKGGGPPVVIARDQYEPHRIIVDPTQVMWHNANLANRGETDAGQELLEIARLAKTSIAEDAGPTTIEDTKNTSRLRSLVIASVPDLYVWASFDDGVKRYGRSGQGERDVAKNLDPQNPTAVAADAVNVYWFLQQPSELWRSGKNVDQGVDAGVTPIATLPGAPEIADMVVDPLALYMVTSGGAVLKVPTPNGGAAVQVGTGHPFPKGIVDDDLYLYFTRTGATDAPGEGKLVMFAKSGSETKVLAEGLDKPRGLAIDRADGETTIYWATFGDGHIRRVRVR